MANKKMCSLLYLIDGIIMSLVGLNALLSSNWSGVVPWVGFGVGLLFFFTAIVAAAGVRVPIGMWNAVRRVNSTTVEYEYQGGLTTAAGWGILLALILIGISIYALIFLGSIYIIHIIAAIIAIVASVMYMRKK